MKWENKVEKFELISEKGAENKLNELGLERWELVATIPTNQGFWAIFKRPKQEALAPPEKSPVPDEIEQMLDSREPPAEQKLGCHNPDSGRPGIFGVRCPMG